jgi:hypothetical protein
MVKRVVENQRKEGGGPPDISRGHIPQLSQASGYSNPLQMKANRPASPTPQAPNEKSGFDGEEKPWWKKILTCACCG